METATYLMSDFKISLEHIDRFVSCRDEVWKLALGKVVERFEEEVNDSSEAVEEAKRSISALEDLPAATEHSDEAKKAFRYFGQERVRSFISAAMQDMLPFQWELNWSVTTVQRRLLQIQSLLEPITVERRSRILPCFPVLLIAIMLDFIWNRGAESSRWWKDHSNIQTVAKACLAKMREATRKKVTVADKERVVKCVELMSILVTLVAQWLGEFDLTNVQGLDKTFQDAIERRIHTAEDPASAEDFCFASGGQVTFLLKLLGTMNSTFTGEILKIVLLQRALLSRGKSTLPGICHARDSGEEPWYCVDEIVGDAVLLFSDMWRLGMGFKDGANDEVVGDIMRVLFVPWDEKRKTVYFERLFFLVLGFMEGVNPKEVDISHMTEDMLRRLNNDGTYRVKFTKGRKNRSIKTGLGQRGPRHQPVVLVQPLWGGSEYGRTGEKRGPDGGRDGAMRKKTRVSNGLAANPRLSDEMIPSEPLDLSQTLFSDCESEEPDVGVETNALGDEEATDIQEPPGPDDRAQNVSQLVAEGNKKAANHSPEKQVRFENNESHPVPNTGRRTVSSQGAVQRAERRSAAHRSDVGRATEESPSGPSDIGLPVLSNTPVSGRKDVECEETRPRRRFALSSTPTRRSSSESDKCSYLDELERREVITEKTAGEATSPSQDDEERASGRTDVASVGDRGVQGEREDIAKPVTPKAVGRKVKSRKRGLPASKKSTSGRDTKGGGKTAPRRGRSRRSDK